MEITVIRILTPTTHYVGEAAKISVEEVILYQIIVASQLQVRNVGTIFFFQNQVRSEVNDLTFFTSDLLFNIQRWHNLDEPVLCDHRHSTVNFQLYAELVGTETVDN